MWLKIKKHQKKLRVDKFKYVGEQLTSTRKPITSQKEKARKVKTTYQICQTTYCVKRKLYLSVPK